MPIFDNQSLSESISELFASKDGKLLEKSTLLSDEDKEKIAQNHLNTLQLREFEQTSRVIKRLFIFSYAFVAIIFVAVFVTETYLIASGLLPVNDRSINSATIMTLVAATFTQIGVAFIILAKYFFEKNKLPK